MSKIDAIVDAVAELSKDGRRLTERCDAVMGRKDADKPQPKSSTEPKYDPNSVNEAIAASNRAGKRISGGEAKKIHGLLKGWRG